MICVSIAEPDFDRCKSMLDKEDFAEIRIDATRFTPEQIKELFSTNVKTIATCRPGQHGTLERTKLLAAAIKAGACYVDIEYESDKEYRNQLVELANKAGCTVIISYHDYEKTPTPIELNNIAESSLTMGAEVIKVACMVNQKSDLLALLSLYQRTERVVAIGMGPEGILSRILAPALGAEFTFAAPDNGKPTAPGQITKSEMKRLIHDIDSLKH